MTRGLKAVYNRLNSVKNSDYIIQAANTSNYQFSIERVVNIVLNETYEDFINIGGWTNLGYIKTDKSDNTFIAPLYTNIKNYPIVNEYVIVLNIADVTRYGSQFAAGLLSSKYPLFSTIACAGILIEVSLVLYPKLNS